MVPKRSVGPRPSARALCVRGHHRVEQRQRDRSAQAAQNRAAGQMLLADEHNLPSYFPLLERGLDAP